MKEKGKFEESWKKVFEGEEVSPSESVWTKIDLDLARKDGVSMRRRVVFYQRIAAASTLLAFLASAFGIYQWNKDHLENIAQQAKPTNSLSGEKNREINGFKSQKNSGSRVDNSLKNKGAKYFNRAEPKTQSKEEENYDLTLDTKRLNLADSVNGNENLETIAPTVKKDNTSSIANSDPKEKMIADRGTTREIGFVPSPYALPVEEVRGEPVMVELVRKLPAIPGAFMNRSHKNKNSQEKIWAAVTAASGMYNSNVSAYSNLNISGVAPSNSSLTGTSYSFGMMGGIRIFSRFVFQSGIQYLNQSVGSVSNISTSGSLYSVANHIASPSLTSGTTSAYNVNSANEFLSVPVQAGYLIIDKKVGWQMNTGVATDFFMRNTLTDPNGQLQSYSQGAGSDSPYRLVNFAGLVNSEVSYRVGSRYRVSLVPGFRYSFSPVLKSTTNTIGNPWVWDVGIKLRYIFK